jgi:hypothetical protein
MMKSVRDQIQPFRDSKDSHALPDFLVQYFMEKWNPAIGFGVYDLHVGGSHVPVCRNAWTGVFSEKEDEVKYA